MHIHTYSSDLPLRSCPASPSVFPTAEKHLHPTPLAKPAAGPHQVASCHHYFCSQSCLWSDHLSSPSQETEETGMKVACFGCPTSWHPGRAAPIQPPAWLTPSCPCSGSEYMLLSSHCLPERKGLGEEKEKRGNRARKTTPGFLHPQETS